MITRAQYKRQFQHVLNIKHGVKDSPYRVEITAPVKEADASLGINQGSVVSLDSNGQFQIGAPAGSGYNHPVPMFSCKNVWDPDVTTGLNATATLVSSGTSKAHTVLAKDSTWSAMGGTITAIPVTAGYELETTEFDASATYAVNDALTAATSTDAGLVTVATKAPHGTEAYLGFVTKAPYAHAAYGEQRIAFLTAFVPAGVQA